MPAEEMVKIDNNIKDFIGCIRRKRDGMYINNMLPEESKIETTNYRPKLWKR